MDLDGLCEPDRLSKQIQVLENENSNFFATNAYIVYENNNIQNYWIILSSIGELKILLTIKIPFPHPSIMFKGGI